MKKSIISVVTPCYNEEDNVERIAERIRLVFSSELSDYEYEHIFIDNKSADKTWNNIKLLSENDCHIKGIRNAGNFGPSRSSAHAMYTAGGDAVIVIAADMQEPPEMIPELVRRWEMGAKVVFGKKTASEESKIMYAIRGLYYFIISKFSETIQFKQVTGWGLYDSEVVHQIRKLNEPEPSMRHIVAELGYEVSFVEYRQEKRKYGKSSYNFRRYLLYAFNTLINTSLVPLRIAIILGSIISFLSFILGIIYLIWKLTDWNRFDAGQAPLLIGMFFIGGVELLFTGIVGEYVGEILKRIKIRPLVIEQEKIGFEKDDERASLELKEEGTVC